METCCSAVNHGYPAIIRIKWFPGQECCSSFKILFWGELLFSLPIFVLKITAINEDLMI